MTNVFSYMYRSDLLYFGKLTNFTTSDLILVIIFDSNLPAFYGNIPVYQSPAGKPANSMYPHVCPFASLSKKSCQHSASIPVCQQASPSTVCIRKFARLPVCPFASIAKVRARLPVLPALCQFINST